jgi:hypothetical protein
MYFIRLESLEGVELILKALRERSQERGCLASEDLAGGIERTLVYVDNATGKGGRARNIAGTAPGPVPGPAKVSPLRVIK